MQAVREARFTLVSFAALAALGALAACGPKYPKCDKDSNCKDHGQVCVEGTCQECRDASQCKTGQVCNAGRCEAKAECSGNADCKDNKVCKAGKCEIECQNAGDCGSGMKCQNNRCVASNACNADSDCGAGMTCIGGRCSSGENASRNMGCEMPVVHFDFNEAKLTGDAKDLLQQAAKCLKEKSDKVTIEGHCDERGTEEYNLALGDARASAVRKYLANLGVPSKRMKAVSKGKLEPIDPGHDEAAWAKNRRAQFVGQ